MKEPDYCKDPFAIATKISNTIVGHVPRTVSCIFDTFLCHGGSIIYTIAGDRRYSSNLSNDGLELPCTDAFISVDKRLLQKARKFLEEGKQVDDDIRVENEVAAKSSKSTAAVFAVTDSTTIKTVTISTASDSVTRNDSFTTVATATATISTTSYCITSEHSYGTQNVHLSDTIMIPSEVVSHDRHSENKRYFFEQ